MTDQDVPHGLYRIWWESGGSSLAAVGVTRDGRRWLAPINWVEPEPVADWSRVIRVERIEVSDAPGGPVGWTEHIRRARDLLTTVLGDEEG